MATPSRGKYQEDTKLISQGPARAEVVLIRTYADGTKTSTTKHYRVVNGQYTDRANLNGTGRGAQRENGKPKAWQGKGRRS